MTTLDVEPTAPTAAAAPSPPADPVIATKKLVLAVSALAMGAFAIGTNEFVSMGLLPNIASDISVSIPKAGNVISAYAVGVVVGAPLIAALAAKAPRRALLIWLMVAFAVGNAASALAPAYGTLLLARFLAGLPHGAFLGVAALVATSLVPVNRRAQAVGWLMLGFSVANIVGVPLATWLGQNFGWRSAYCAVVVVGLLTAAAVWRFAPAQCPAEGATMRSELSALRRPQVLIALVVGTVGFGGLFATYTYIAPTLVHSAGLSSKLVPVALAIAGVGMVIGNIVGGKIADRGVVRGIWLGLLLTAAVMVLFFFAVHNVVTGILTFALVPVAAGVLVPALQTRLMDVAGDGQTLAAALNHSALNIANALGAWLGGVAIALGLGYPSTGLVGAVLALMGLAVFAGSMAVTRRKAAEIQMNPT